MRMESILSLMSLLRPAMGGAMLRRALVPIAMMVALAVFAGMLLAMIVGIGLLSLFHTLMAHGTSPEMALSGVALAALALLLLVVLAICRVATRAQRALRPRLGSKVVQAFLDGFNTPQK